MKKCYLSAVLMVASLGSHSWCMAADCKGLLNAKFADTQIAKAEPVTNRTLRVSEEFGGTMERELQDLPVFCRVVAIVRPRPEATIGFELWLPDNWNGRYLQGGNGGFAGVIDYTELDQGIRKGFAVASTDDGHVGWDAKWALGRPERVEDYGFRAVHLTRLTAMAITRAYYDRPPSHNYFMGCSDGGRESLMEAQRYPDDFDGWVVGAPANNFTALMVYFLHDAQLLSGLEEPLGPLQLQALTKAALRSCDAADGLQDGLVNDPLHCPFDPAELECKGAADGSCLTTAQVAAVRRLYDGPRDAKTRARLAPGLRGTVGTESGDASQWPLWLTGPSSYPDIKIPLANFFSENFWPFMVYADPKIDLKTLELTQAAARARSSTGAELNSLDPDLNVVRAAGKKIIQYHGWSDVAIPAELSIAYYQAVEKYGGRDNRDFYRLFMVPGMGHCLGGPGPNMFGASYHSPKAATDPEHDVLAALISWVETGTAPERIIATKYQDDDASKPVLRTRPLCVYPKVARYTGRGSIDDAHNFVCQDK